jgi:S1-C subfamily serine protease
MTTAAKLAIAVWGIFIIATAVLFSLPANAAPDESTPTPGVTLAQAAKGTYRMYHGSRFACSGVFVKSTEKEDLFLTAAHCGDGKDMSITLDKFDSKFVKISSKVFFLKPVRTLKKLDVMVFKTMDASGDWVVSPIADQREANAMDFGTPISAIGYPKGLEITLTHGEFLNRVKPIMREFDQQEPVYKTTIPFTGGSSGGGVWLKTSTGYKIVGLVSHHFRDVSFMGYITTTKSLHRVTRNLLK